MIMALTDDKEVRDKLKDMNKQMGKIISDKKWDDDIRAMEEAPQREGIGNAIAYIYIYIYIFADTRQWDSSNGGNHAGNVNGPHNKRP